MFLRILDFLNPSEGRPIPVIGKYWRRFVTYLFNKAIKKTKLPRTTLNDKPRKEKVIASLTSFPTRINYVEFAIKSLMLQSYKPDRIILWLAKEQFEGLELPKSLLKLQDHGLEIKWVDEDLRGHKKYFYIVEEQRPDELLITFDDDIIFSTNCIKNLVRKHKKFPKAVVMSRGYEITFDKKGVLESHTKWKIMSRYGVKKPEKLMHASCGAGCLYPYGAFHKDIRNSTMMKKCASGIDDLWMTMMVILADTKFVKTRYATKYLVTVEGSQEYQLFLENTISDGVDKYEESMRLLSKEYPELKQKISIQNK